MHLFCFQLVKWWLVQNDPYTCPYVMKFLSLVFLNSYNLNRKCTMLLVCWFFFFPSSLWFQVLARKFVWLLSKFSYLIKWTNFLAIPIYWVWGIKNEILLWKIIHSEPVRPWPPKRLQTLLSYCHFFGS